MSNISPSKVIVTAFGVCFLTLIVACVLWWPSIKQGIHSATADSNTPSSPRDVKPIEPSSTATVQVKPPSQETPRQLSPPKPEEQPQTPKREAKPATQETPTQVTPTTAPVATPVWRVVTRQSFVVGAHDSYRVPIFVSADDAIARVAGTYQAAGGMRDAINVHLVDNEGYDNFSHNSRFMTYWSTRGEMHTASFDLRLKAGSYYLVFDNRSALLTNKGVSVSVGLLPNQ